ncbi:MAG: ATP-binding protein [Kiritimatiellia bacterium]
MKPQQTLFDDNPMIEQEHLEEVLCASELRYRRLFESAKDGILILDAETGMIVDVNPYLIHLLGLPHKDFLGKKLWELGLFHHIIANKIKFAELQTRKYVRYDDLPLETVDGRQIAVEFVSNVYLEGENKVIQCNIRDISERKRGEQALLQSETRYHALFDNMVEGFAYCRMLYKDDQPDNFVYLEVNQAFTTLTGLENVVGRKVSELIPGIRESDPDLFAHYGRVARTGQSEQFEIYIESMKMWFSISLYCPEKDHFISVFNVITARKALESQILRVQRMESIGTLAGGIAHDLNNVLAPILMAVEILGEKLTDDEDLEMLAALEASARHGAELVRQVLGFARGIEGRRIPVNLIDILNVIQSIVRDTFPKNIQFNIAPARDVWTVTGDPTQVQQVFTNLCVNARDAMPGGGRLCVSMENIVVDNVPSCLNPEVRPGAYVLVKITDTGSGIPMPILERIFEPFFTTKTIGEGTGMGLSTTMAIVKSHGGVITVSSQVGKGSTFKVYLPADTASKEVDPVPVKQEPFPRGHGEVVLVVDDEEGIRLIAQKTLERFGYRVLLAANGAEALDVYAQNGEEIAIVLTDMSMPVMDGAATLAALRKLNPRIKAIASSGLSSNEDSTSVSGAGFTHFIAKPYRADALLTLLAKALQ